MWRRFIPVVRISDSTSHTVPCRAVLCHAVLCYVILCHAVSCHTMPCRAVLHCVIPCHAVLCAMPCCAVLYHVVLCRVMPCHAVPCGRSSSYLGGWYLSCMSPRLPGNSSEWFYKAQNDLQYKGLFLLKIHLTSMECLDKEMLGITKSKARRGGTLKKI